MQRFADGMAARTRFFDDFFADATARGLRQAVILASGLDARAYRLAWPAGTVVFEIDQPEVIAFKTGTLAELGAEPDRRLRTVAVDLREDWPAALPDAGFDTTTPTAWIAEGLFGYLPPEAQDRLLDQITALSAPGSRLGAEGVPHTRTSTRTRSASGCSRSPTAGASHGFDLDFSELVFLGDRTEVTTYLHGHGWRHHQQRRPTNCSTRYGLAPLDDRRWALRRRRLRHRRASYGGRGDGTFGQPTAGTWPPASARRRPWSPPLARWRPRSPTPLIDDPYAAPLVRAVGIDFFTKLVDGESRSTDDADDGGAAAADDRRDGGAHPVLRRLLHRSHGRRASGRR